MFKKSYNILPTRRRWRGPPRCTMFKKSYNILPSKTLNFGNPQSKPSHRLFAMGRAEAGVALSIKRSGIDRRNLLAEREAYLAPLSRVS